MPGVLARGFRLEGPGRGNLKGARGRPERLRKADGVPLRRLLNAKSRIELKL